MLGENRPVLQNTLFGWAVVGTVANDVSNTHCYLSKETNSKTSELHDDLKKFWELEECNSCNRVFCRY